MEEKILAIQNVLDEKVKEIQQIVGEKNFNFKDFYFAGGCIYCLWNDKERTERYSANCRNISFDTIDQYCKKMMLIYFLN